MLSWPHSLPLARFGGPGDSGGSVGGSVVEEAVAHVLCRPSLPRAATRKAYCVAARSPVTSMPVAAVDRSTCSGRAAASEADDSVYPTRYVLAPSTGSHSSVTDWHVEAALTT